jgi:leucyl-tRNA synthetase
MDTFIDTTWYYLRCANPRYAAGPCDPDAVRRWAPADVYVGGIEIAVPIMLYGSFITKALRDAGLCDFSLPCRRLLAHEMVLKDGKKMSKSLGNTVDPETLVERVGADTVRFFILSLAPPLKKIEWSEARLLGCHKLLRRVWGLGLRQAARMVAPDRAATAAVGAVEEDLSRHVEETVRAVTADMERLQPNTCLTALIKLLYKLEELERQPDESGGVIAARPVFREAFRTLLVLLAPVTPHLCAELWERLGFVPDLARASWPRVDPGAGATPSRRIAIKVDAETVAQLDVAAGASRDDVLALAYAHEAVRARLGAGRARREIYVPDRMLNLVTERTRGGETSCSTTS